MSEYSYYSESKSVVPVQKLLQQPHEGGESEYESFEESQEQE